MQTKVLSVSNLCKKYGKDKRILDGVSFTLYESEVFGLLGPNGAGKSTTMKCIVGLLEPDSAEIEYHSLSKFPPKAQIAKIVGVVPQEEQFYRSFTVKENMEYFGMLYGLRGKKLDERVDYLVKWLNLDKFKNKQAEHLSGGYRRLLNVAISLVHDPKIIFLDEPTVGLDPDIRIVFWEKILELRRQRKAVCITTHYMDEAQQLCDKIGIVWQGKLLVQDSPHSLIKEYGGNPLLVLRLSDNPSENLLKKISSFLPGAIVNTEQNTLMISLKSEHPLDSISGIGEMIKEEKLQVINLELKEPSLEDVFLNLVGEKSGIKTVENN